MTDFEDDWQAWKFLESRGYTQENGIIKYRPEKRNNMPSDEAHAIDYLFMEWDWDYM